MTSSTKLIDGVYSRSENSAKKDYWIIWQYRYIYRQRSSYQIRDREIGARVHIGIRKLAVVAMNINIWASFRL